MTRRERIRVALAAGLVVGAGFAVGDRSGAVLAALAAGSVWAHRRLGGQRRARQVIVVSTGGWVYLVRASSTGLHKIGWSGNEAGPHERFAQLQRGSQEQLVLVAGGPGPMSFERQLHAHFDAWRVTAPHLEGSTEWFALPPDRVVEARALLNQAWRTVTR